MKGKQSALALAMAIAAMTAAMGCETTKYVHECETRTMRNAEYMPRSYELKYSKPRVAITVTDKTQEIGTQANLDNIFRTAIERYVSEVGAEFITLDAGQNRELQRLIDATQSRSSRSRPISETADYAIWAVISSVDLDSEYVAPTRRDDGSSSDPQCRYTAVVSGSLRIYDVGEKQIIDSMNIHDSVSDSRDTTSSSCLITSNIKALIARAAEDAIGGSGARLKNFFAPKAYISQRKVCEEKNLFKISMGKNFSLTKGMDVKIYSKSTVKNPFSQEVSVEERLVAEGVVVEPIETSYAWVKVGETERAEKIRLGDYAKIDFAPGILDKVWNFGRKIIH